MGLLDDIKNTIGSSNDSSSFGEGGTSENPFGGEDDFSQNDGRNDTPDFDSNEQQGSQLGEKQQGLNPNQQGTQPNNPRTDSRIDNQAGGGESRNPVGSQRSTDNNQPRSASVSNPQAGRPERGGSSPQLSKNTRKKIDNAGLNSQSQNRGSSEVDNSELRDILEEIRGQNQQMIEILEKISQNLERGTSRRR